MPRSRASGLMAIACRFVLVAALLFVGYGVGLVAWRFPVAAMLLLGVVMWRRRHRRRATDDHGSARVASLYEMEKAGLLAEDGLLLGRALPDPPSLAAATAALLSPCVRSETACRGFLAATYSKRWQRERLIRTNKHVHFATFSPAGGGKGIAAMIPNLLSYRGNCVIVDVKGELYRAAAQHRRDKFGKKAYRLDPFEVCGPGGDTLNPFDFIDEKKDGFSRPLSGSSPTRSSSARRNEKQPHFNEMAELKLVAFTAFVCGCQHDRATRHLGTVRHCASSRNLYSQAVELMQKTDACQGVIRRLAGQLTFPAEEEQVSIFRPSARHTAFLDSPVVARNVASSSFDPMELKTGNADLYLILPHDMLVSHPDGSCGCGSTPSWPASPAAGPMNRGKCSGCSMRWRTSVPCPPSRKRPRLSAAWAYVYGSCSSPWASSRPPSATKHPTILDNIGTQQYFGINSYETAEEISKRIGTATIGTASANRSTSSSRPTGNAKQEGGNVSASSGITYNEIGRTAVPAGRDTHAAR